MLKLTARAGKPTGAAKNFLGAVRDGDRLRGVAEMPGPAYFTIEEGGSGYFLFYFDAEDQCYADGWYESLAEAKRTALRGFGVEESDWADLTT